MTDHDALLRAVAARPADDLPRLVYADFLDETGDPARAEFVRVQCALARLPAGHPDRPPLAAREADLLREHRPRWVIPGLHGGQTFRRGFVEAVRTAAEWLLAAPRPVFGTAPVRELTVSNVDRFVDPLARLPDLARLETLTVRNSTLGAGDRLAQFLAAADLARLTALALPGNRLWPDSLHALARSAVLPRLRRLDLSGNPVGDAGVDVLAASPAYGGLTDLVLRSDELPYYDSIHAAGAAALARSWTLRGLRDLDLSGHYVGDAGLIDLANSPVAAGLVRLDVANNEIGELGDGAFEAVAASRHFDRLRRLDLGRSRVNALAAAALVRWPRLAAGATVGLRDCDFDPRALDVLLRSPARERFEFSEAALSPVPS